MTHKFSLEDVQKEWEKNSKIDFDNLGTESIRIPVIHNKYLKIYIDERIRLKGMEFELSKLVRAKTTYYKGEMSQEELEERNWEPFLGSLLKNEIGYHIETDDDYIKIKQNIVVQQEKTNYLDSIIKQLNNRGFQIKNAIDWIKYSNAAS